MPRRGSAKIRQIEPDSIYKNRLLARLINRAMKDGKKSVAQKQVYGALDLIKERTKEDPLKIFSQAISNVKPTMEVKPRRVGGAAYQIPMTVRGPRRESLAIRWIVEAARSRSNSEYHTYSEKLAAELIDAAKGEGVAIKKKANVERMAEANRAFAHFRW